MEHYAAEGSECECFYGADTEIEYLEAIIKWWNEVDAPLKTIDSIDFIYDQHRGVSVQVAWTHMTEAQVARAEQFKTMLEDRRSP